MKKLSIAFLSLVLLVLGIGTAEASVKPNLAACKSKRVTIISDISRKNVITGASRVENFTGRAGKITRTVTKSATVSASVKVTTGAEVSGSAVIGSLKVATGLELQAAGSKTSSDSVSIELPVAKNDVSIFYTGTHQVTAKFVTGKINCTTGFLANKSKGKVQSWTIETNGGVSCKTNPPKGSMAYVAKAAC